MVSAESSLKQDAPLISDNCWHEEGNYGQCVVYKNLSECANKQVSE